MKQASKPTKKIDMGAALTFGKAATDSVVINSPTHRNTHNEVFVSSNKNRNEILEDIFSSASAGDDDFNPRAEEAQEFGDFESAFGKPAATKAVPAPPSPTPNTEFADFSSAFSGAPSVPATIASNDLIDDSNFLFETPKPVAAPISSPLASMDLFGSNILNNNTQQKASDLLSDFGDLSLGGSGEYLIVHIYYLSF